MRELKLKDNGTRELEAKVGTEEAGDVQTISKLLYC